MNRSSAGSWLELVAMLVAGLGMVAGAAYFAVPAASQGAVTVTGLWLDDEGKAGIEVKPCGAELCGAIVWLKTPLDPKGQPWKDILNPDTGKRARQVCGLQVIGGLKAGDKGLWQDGWVYDPEEGKTFSVELSLKDANTLTVFGYAGVRLLGETLLWKRLPADSARCKA